MSNPLILVVDDDENVTATIKNYFEIFTDFSIIPYNNPKDALKIVDKENLDLIISDFVMPEMNGIEFLLEVRKMLPEIPVILLTGLADKMNAIRAINEVGIYYYMEKPWDNDKLQLTICNALEKKKLTHELSNQVKKLQDQSHAIITALAKAIEAKDEYTENHVERVKDYAFLIGKELGLPESKLEILKIAALLHDIGKIGVPDEILNKPGKLTDAEFTVIKRHPLIAQKICASVESLRHALPIILQHHEKLDGSGYPYGLKGDAILIESRILAVVDIFDALTSDRAYRKGMPLHKAFEILLEEARANKLDSHIVETLIDIIQKEQFQTVQNTTVS